MPISVVINTKNASATISSAIASVAFADEVVVVDMYSIDGTAEIAKGLGARVFFHKDVHYVEPAREFAIEKAKYDWVLVLDADETIPSSLADKLTEIARSEHNSEVVAYEIPRQNIIFRKWMVHSGWWPDYQLRFFKKGSVTWPSAIHAKPNVKGSSAKLAVDSEFAIVHRHYNSISEFLDRMNRYTTIQAQALPKTKKTMSFSTVFTAFQRELLSRLFAQDGYKDGNHGIALSLLQSFSEVTRILKVWEATGFEQKPFDQTTRNSLYQLRSELAYWLADQEVRQSNGLYRYWWRLRRKLQF